MHQSFPTNCILGQIPIDGQALCSEPLKCSPVSSRTRSFLGKYFFTNFSLFVLETRQLVLFKVYWPYLSGKVYKNWLACQIQKKYERFWKKKVLALTPPPLIVKTTRIFFIVHIPKYPLKQITNLTTINKNDNQPNN